MCGMAIELRGFDDLKDDLVNMAYALDQGPGVNRALKAGAVPIEQQMLCPEGRRCSHRTADAA